MNTEQIQLWRSDFGRKYTERNLCRSLAAFNKVYVDRFGKTKAELNRSFLEGYVDQESRILEVGSNVGYQLLNLQKSGYRYLYGVEIQRVAIEKGKKIHTGIDIVEGSALDLPFKDNFFDMVFTETVLIHFSPDDISQALAEIYRCSRKYIWGFEYFAEELTEVKYHGIDRFVWKGNYASMFLKQFPDLEMVREQRFEYLNDKGKTAAMYLLRKPAG